MTPPLSIIDGSDYDASVCGYDVVAMWIMCFFQLTLMVYGIATISIGHLTEEYLIYVTFDTFTYEGADGQSHEE